MRNKVYPLYDVDCIATINELIDLCDRKYANQTAFQYRENKEIKQVSYSQFVADIKNAAMYLEQKSLSKKHIAILGENSYEWIVCFFAVLFVGGVCVPIDKGLDEKDIAKQLIKADCTALICSFAYKDYDFASVQKMLMSDLWNSVTADTFKPCEASPDDLAEIVFTSGTTGEPKGVMLTHGNLASNIVYSSKNLLIPEGTVLMLPLHHTFGMMACVLCQLFRGYSVFINSSIKRLMQDINEAKPKHISVVPMILEAFYKNIWAYVRKQGKETAFKSLICISNILLKVGIDIRRKLFKPVIANFGGNLEMLITGGASIDEKYITFFTDIGIKVINGYGITECSPIISTLRNKHHSTRSVGTHHPDIKVMINNPDKNGIGEICVSGPIVSIGYYNDKKATDDAFIDGWFHTGDLGHVDNDGLLYITGRKKNLIILSNGENVSAEELENKICAIMYVLECVVYGKDGIITAEVYTDPELSDAAAMLEHDIAELNKSLPQYKNIGRVIRRKIPFEKTTTMKIKRKLGNK